MESPPKQEVVKDLRKRFWGRWEKADELDKIKIVGELSGVGPPYISPTLFNSYCLDLYEYITKKYKIEDMRDF